MKSAKRLLAGLLCCTAILAGCSAPEEQKVTCQELTLILPVAYEDLSGESYAEGFSLIYGTRTEAVLVSYETIAALDAYIPASQPDSYAYAKLLAPLVGAQEAPVKAEDFAYFTYEAVVEDTEITYLCGIFQSSDKYWTVMFYCASAEFSARKANFMGFLEAVVVD